MPRLFEIMLANRELKPKIYAECSDGSEYVIVHHLDGMYSYGTTEKGNVVHLAGGTQLKEEGDGYVLEIIK